jgi:hypothetical protein
MNNVGKPALYGLTLSQPVAEQIAILLSVTSGLLDDVEISAIPAV